MKSIIKTAKLFQNGKSQAVRLPREYRFEGKEVLIKKIGKNVVLIPKKDYWEELFASLDKFSGDFMDDRNQPEIQERVTIFK